MTVNQKAAWEQYWHSGQHQGCIELSSRSGYSAEYVKYWDAVFNAALPGSQILDICTGNGAIAGLAAKYSEKFGKMFEVYGFDQVPVASGVIESSPYLQNVNFESGAGVETLPFDDNQFDIVISQFGFEYTDWNASLAQTSRVTKPGGRLNLFLHSSEGLSVIAAKRSLQFITFLFDKNGYLDILSEFVLELKAQGQLASSPNQKLSLLNQSLIIAKRGVEEYQSDKELKDMINELFNLTKYLFKSFVNLSEEQIVKCIEIVKHSLLSHKKRLELCIDAALSKAGATQLAQLAGTCGYSLVAAEQVLNNNKQVLGHSLQFVKQKQ